MGISKEGQTRSRPEEGPETAFERREGRGPRTKGCCQSLHLHVIHFRDGHLRAHQQGWPSPSHTWVWMWEASRRAGEVASPAVQAGDAAGS